MRVFQCLSASSHSSIRFQSDIVIGNIFQTQEHSILGKSSLHVMSGKWLAIDRKQVRYTKRPDERCAHMLVRDKSVIPCISKGGRPGTVQYCTVSYLRHCKFEYLA